MEQFKQTTSSKKRFKLNDVAEQLQVKKFVIRAWEKEFNIETQAGSYSIREVEFLRKIKQLVVVENCSLEQAKSTLLVPLEQVCEAPVAQAPFLEEMVGGVLAQECAGNEEVVEQEVACAADVSVEAKVEICSEKIAAEAITEPFFAESIEAVPVHEIHVAAEIVAAPVCQEPMINLVQETVVEQMVAGATVDVPVCEPHHETYDSGSDLIEAGELPEVEKYQAASREIPDANMQKFLSELAFFKQELQKFQSLLENA